MIEFSGRCVLLDIEGTTSSIRFVYDVMFPYVRRELDRFLGDRWGDPKTADVLSLIAADAGFDSPAEWFVDRDETQSRLLVRDEVLRLMDADIKATGLKQLQGMIWKDGFESGELKAHVYEDVPTAIRDWTAGGVRVFIYSSGSVAAQKLFFAHTVAGDLLDSFSGHFDTTTGPKKESESYRTISRSIGLEPSEILFLSDIDAELDAASDAGLRTGLSVRPGNPTAENRREHRELTSFDQVRLGE